LENDLKVEACLIYFSSEAHTGWAAHTATTHGSELLHHHGVLLSSEHHQFHLFLLHEVGNFGVLVNLVLEESSLEFLLGVLVIDVNPVVSDARNHNWDHHWVF